MVTSQWSLRKTLLVLVPLFAATARFAAFKHYRLPAAVGRVARDDPRVSEAHVLDITQHLSETIGYRTVGTREHAAGDAWMFAEAQRLQQECARLVRDVHVGRHLECEVWRQEGSGHHRFDIMGYRLYKTYVNLSNIVVRVSNGTEAGKAHAVLANAHLDSTPPSPGAADDALAVGVLLECLRVLIHTKDWEPSHAIIFLFNNAEESLQDGSHLYSTQHPTASTVRAVINLEAAGSMGPELLFQATSDEMIEAYATVPRPYGTVMANDVFSSGIILSDTDFRQFQQYLNATGVDMAVVGHSYFYHTSRDTVEHIEPGVAQHMAENALALLHHFTAPASPLPRITPSAAHTPHLVYFSLLGTWFFRFSFRAAAAAYVAFLGAAGAVAFELCGGGVRGVARGVGRYVGGVLGAVVCANVVAGVMRYVLGRGMSWFAREWLPIVLYGPPAVFGTLLPQVYLPRTRATERETLLGTLLALAGLGALAQGAFELGSAVFPVISAVALFVGIVLDAAGGGWGVRRAVVVRHEGVNGDAGVGVGNGDAGGKEEEKGEVQWEEGPVRLRTYIVGGIVPVLVGTEVWCGIADVFVPLTGRMGEDAPAEHIIASITALLGSHFLPLLPALAQRFRAGPRALLLCGALAAGAAAGMCGRGVYDGMHPRRVFVMHSENITTGEVHLNFAGADSAPGLPKLVEGLAGAFGGSEYALDVVDMNDWNGDWDTLYPFSAFLTPYKIQLPAAVNATASAYSGFGVEAVDDVVYPAAGTRRMTLRVRHPGVIWTVIAFDAHVLEWSLDHNPPPHHARHHIKEASFFGTDVWSIDLLIQLPSSSSSPTANASITPGPNTPSTPGLTVNFVGTKEAVQWPAKRGREGEVGGGEELRLLEAMHVWLNETTGDAVDALLFGTVGGVVVV